MMNRPSRSDARLDRRDAHVLGQRGLELREQVGPRERPHVDDGVRLSRRDRHHLEFLGVHLRSRPVRRRARSRVASFEPERPRRPATADWSASRSSCTTLNIVIRMTSAAKAPSSGLHGADVVERARRKVGA